MVGGGVIRQEEGNGGTVVQPGRGPAGQKERQNSIVTALAKRAQHDGHSWGRSEKLRWHHGYEVQARATTSGQADKDRSGLRFGQEKPATISRQKTDFVPEKSFLRDACGGNAGKRGIVEGG